jgi:hypothetical protein
VQLSVYDLAYTYFKTYAPGHLLPLADNKRKVLTRINQLLHEGWTDTDLLNKWASGEEPNYGNLLKPDEFYWHNQLRLMPGATKVTLDIDSGEITRKQEPWFLEMKASFTLDEVVAYYLSQFGLCTPQINLNKYRGTFRYLLTRYDVDLLLFMIDSCVNQRRDSDDGPPLEPITLNEYERSAQSSMNRKITESRQVGGDWVVPRRRVSLD